ncbi:MAG: hypothetical protein IKF07_02795 [Eubacterium sp.]|nr:hypothetical protein [Eubacterium sp.]
MKKNVLIVLLTAVLLTALLAGCSGVGMSEEEKKSQFLIGTWTATEATVNGVTKDPSEIFQDALSLDFVKGGDCTMSIGDKQSELKWELVDDGVILSGEDTYTVTFPDAQRKTLMINIKGIDILMEKAEEEK